VFFIAGRRRGTSVKYSWGLKGVYYFFVTPKRI